MRRPASPGTADLAGPVIVVECHASGAGQCQGDVFRAFAEAGLDAGPATGSAGGPAPVSVGEQPVRAFRVRCRRLGAQLNAPDLRTARPVIVERTVIAGWLGVGDQAIRYSGVTTQRELTRSVKGRGHGAPNRNPSALRRVRRFAPDPAPPRAGRKTTTPRGARPGRDWLHPRRRPAVRCKRWRLSFAAA